MKRETDDGTKINQLAVCDKQEGNQSWEGGGEKKKKEGGWKKEFSSCSEFEPHLATSHVFMLG